MWNDLFSEYQIPGTPRPGLCHFTYRSTSRLEGRFNSPRHPQNYPNDLNCTYLFLATPSQQVRPGHQMISSQRWFMCLSKIFCTEESFLEKIIGNCFRSKSCLIISRFGLTTSTPTAASATGRLMAGRSAMTTGLRSSTFTWISQNSFWEGEKDENYIRFL